MTSDWPFEKRTALSLTTFKFTSASLQTADSIRRGKSHTLKIDFGWNITLSQCGILKLVLNQNPTLAGEQQTSLCSHPCPKYRLFWLSTEVTKVRRNLFNQEIVSPSKKAKLPRSQSVSAVEGLKRKRSHSEGTKLLLNYKTYVKEGMKANKTTLIF